MKKINTKEKTMKIPTQKTATKRDTKDSVKYSPTKKMNYTTKKVKIG